MALPSTITYKELRTSYDVAFRQLGRQLQRVNLLQICEDVESAALSEARRQLTEAQCCYLEARNSLAGYLLSRKAQNRRLLEERTYILRANADSASEKLISSRRCLSAC